MPTLSTLEKTLLLDRFAAWLGPDLYEPRFDAAYCRVFEQVADAALGALPAGLDAASRMDALGLRWGTFAAVADAAARRWTAAHRPSAAPTVIWPSRNVASRVRGFAGSTMRPRLDLNLATAAELEALPGFGPKTAARAVAWRSAFGPYAALDDLRHVEGLAKAERERAAPFLAIVPPVSSSAPLLHPALLERDGPLGFPACLVVMHASGFAPAGIGPAPGAPRASAAGLALAALQHVAEDVRRAPAWAPDRRTDVSWMRLARDAARRTRSLEDRAAMPATVGVVRNAAYLDVALALIERARTRVWVQMFFFSSPGDTSPGDKLIDALAAARTRGVDVRLILDSDLDSDYHGASRVNDETLQRLDATGVAYRRDELGTTSHGKAMLVDDDQLLVGSHNWTTPAMYLLEETSLYLESAALSASERTRFDRLWRRYDPDPARRDIDFALLAYPLPAERRALELAGHAGSRSFLEALPQYAGVERFADDAGLDGERLLRLWRLLRLMHAFGFPEATAFALTLTPVDSPSDFVHTARRRTLALLRALDPLPEPFARQRIRFDIVEAADVR